jgi:hypothetical protein
VPMQMSVVVCDCLPEAAYITGMLCAYMRGGLLMQPVPRQHVAVTGPAHHDLRPFL